MLRRPEGCWGTFHTQGFTEEEWSEMVSCLMRVSWAGAAGRLYLPSATLSMQDPALSPPENSKSSRQSSTGKLSLIIFMGLLYKKMEKKKSCPEEFILLWWPVPFLNLWGGDDAKVRVTKCLSSFVCRQCSQFQQWEWGRAARRCVCAAGNHFTHGLPDCLPSTAAPDSLPQVPSTADR